MTVYRQRSLGKLLSKALTTLPVVVVTGLRQSGKTTFLQNEPSLTGRRYVNLDDLTMLAAARGDPEVFVRGADAMTIDEAHRCPELLLAIKREVDRDRRPGRFVLSGLANFSLLEGMSESLAGRAVYLTLPPFTHRELHSRTHSEPVILKIFSGSQPSALLTAPAVTAEDVVTGGLPPICLNKPLEPTLWFKGYEQTYLERDVRALARVGDLVAFRTLLHLTAQRSGQVLSYAEIARDAKLNAETTRRHLGLLEASFVIHRLAPFLANRASRLIKSPKIYIGDSGLACYLNDFNTSADGVGNLQYGAMLETYVANNLAGIIAAEWPKARLSYWHVQGRHEVDFVIEAGRDCMAIEVKATTRWDDRDLAGLRAFLATTPRCKAALLAYGGEHTLPLGDRLWAIPIGHLLA